MDEAQRTRFEFFMRSHFNKNDIVSLLSDTLRTETITEDMGIITASLAKLLVGEIMTTGNSILLHVD
jgi:ABC-type antimicrobial peptide transport system ATPase subunit